MALPERVTDYEHTEATRLNNPVLDHLDIHPPRDGTDVPTPTQALPA